MSSTPSSVSLCPAEAFIAVEDLFLRDNFAPAPIAEALVAVEDPSSGVDEEFVVNADTSCPPRKRKSRRKKKKNGISITDRLTFVRDNVVDDVKDLCFAVVEENKGTIYGPEPLFYSETIPDEETPSLLMNKKFFEFFKQLSALHELSDDNSSRMKVIVQTYETLHNSDNEIQTESAMLSRVNVIDAALRKHVSAQFIDISTFIIDLFHFVYRVFTTNDPNEIPYALRSLLRIHGVATIESILLSQLCRPFLNFKKKQIYTESKPIGDDKEHLASETVDQFGDMMEYVFDSAFADAVKNVLVAAACLKMTDYQMSMRIFEILGKRPPGSLFEITKGAVKSLAIIVRAVEDIVIGKEDLHTILFAKDRWIMAMQTFSTLQTRRVSLRVGIMKENDGKHDRVEWLNQATELKAYLSKRLSNTSQAKPLYLQIANMVNSLDEWTTQVRNEAGAYYRLAPIGFCIAGPPKIGKSSLIDLHASLHAAVMGRTFKPELIYHRNMSSKFHDGLKEQPYIHYSEVGSDCQKIAESHVDEITQEITSVIDSQPMLANMAEAHEKGKTWINFELALIDTNNPTMNFNYNKMNPGAYLRRFFHVEAQVKEEYSENGTTLSQSKARLAKSRGLHPMDLWHFTLKGVDVEDNAKYRWFTHEYVDRNGDRQFIANLDVFEYCYAVKQLIRLHIRDQTEMSDAKKDGTMFDAHLFENAEEYKAQFDIPSDEKEALDEMSRMNIDPTPSRSATRIVKMRNARKIAGKVVHDKVKNYRSKVYYEDDDLDSCDTDDCLIDLLAEDLGDLSQNPVVQMFDQPQREISSGDDDDKEEFGWDGEFAPSVPLSEPIVTESGVDMFTDWLKGPDTSKARWLSNPSGLSISHMPDTVQEFVLRACEDHAVFVVDVQESSKVFAGKHIAGDHLIYFTAIEATYTSADFRKKVCQVFRDHGISDVIFGPIDLQTVKKSDQLDSVHIDRGLLSIVPLVVNDLDNEQRMRMAHGDNKFALKPLDLVKNSLSYAGGAVGSTFVWVWDNAWSHELFMVTLSRYFMISTLFLITFGFIPFSLSCTLSMFTIYFKQKAKERCHSLGLWARTKWHNAYEYFDVQWRENVFENFVFGSHIGTLLLTFSSLISLPFVLAYWTQKKEKKDSESGELTSLEDEFGCGTSVKRRAKAAIADDFGLWDTLPSKSKCTGLPGELVKKVMRNVRALEVREEGVVGRTGYVTGVSGDAVVTSAHYFWGKGPFDVRVYRTANGSKEGAFFDKRFTRDEFQNVGDDIVCFRLPGFSFVNLIDHIGDGKFNKTGECFIAGALLTAEVGKEPFTTIDKLSAKEHTILHYLLYPKVNTKVGSCGLPAIFQKDKGSAWCAIHGSGNATHGFAPIIDKSRLLEAIKYQSLIVTESCSSPEYISIISSIIDEETELEENSLCSPFHYNAFYNLEFRGKWPGSKAKISQKSALQYMEISQRPDFVDMMFEIFGEFQKVEFVRPIMKPQHGPNGTWLCPYSLALAKANKNKRGLSTCILEKVIVKLSDRLVEGINANGVSTLNPLTAELAINGDVDDDFLRRISASTASGFGFTGKKENHIVLGDDGVRRMTPELSALVCSIIKYVKTGNRLNFVYVASLKDEPRDVTKVRQGKTRVFYISPLSLLILQRMFLSPFYTLMVQMSEVFCAALGVNMHADANSLYQRLITFSDKWMEGDYGGYDLQMPFEIGQAAASVVLRTLRRLGYSESALTVVHALLDSGLFPTVYMNGDVFCVPALQPSGKYATAEDNSLRGLIMLMYFWECSSHSNKDFFSFVLPLLYGDDMLAAVKPEVAEEINNITYAKHVAECYGMEFTNAQKTSDLLPFVFPCDASFLKRRWMDHSALSGKVAALEIDSIYRMLTWILPSSFVSKSVQVLATYDSALREAFFHLDEQKYDMFRRYLGDDFLSQWPTLESTTWERLQTFNQLVNKFSAVTESGILTDTLKELVSERQDMKEELSEFDGKTYVFVRQTREYCNLERYRQVADEYFARQSRKEELDQAIVALNQSIEQAKSDKIWTQSGSMMEVGMIEEEKVMVRENVVDVGGDVENTSSLGNAIDLTRPTHLQPTDFVMRPIKIAQLSVSLATDVGQQYNVWNLLSLDPSVRSKLRNYSLMRADIEITVEVAASPFHYGRLMVTYVPKPASNEITTAMLASSSGYRNSLLKYLSQQIGTRVLDLRENKPLVMTIPYINYQPFCRLYVPGSSTSLGTGTAIPDLFNMGNLCVYTLNQLQASNSSAPTSALVYVYARFVNVTLAAPTASQTAITTESGEMKEGPMEQISTALSVTSQQLEKVPIFSPWAQAATMIFKGMGKLASVYGWSEPRVEPSITPPVYMYNDPYSSNAVTIGRSMAHKVAFDPLQATSVDPRIVGVEEDELTFASIARRLCLLDTFQWYPSSTPMSTILWSAAVIPNNNTLGPILTTNAFIQPTPVSFVSSAFDFWCGDIEYTFDFVASALHRGKVLIQLEPNIAQYALITSNPQLNKQFSLVLDLQEVQRVSICVKWMQPRMWLRVPPMLLANRSVAGNLSPVPLQGYANGFITVTPFTSLQSPDGSSIAVNVFVRSKNLRLNQFDNVNLPSTRAFTQSGFFPEEVTCKDLGEPVLDIGAQTSLNFGEQPVSMRSYLKRYVNTNTDATVTTTANTTNNIRPPIYPTIKASYNGASTRPDALSYLRYAYLGVIGGVRKRLTTMGLGYKEMDRMTVTLNEAIGTTGSTGAASTGTCPSGDAKGTVAFVPSTQGGVEVELPMYTNNYFLPSGISTTNTIKSGFDSNFDVFYTDSYYWSVRGIGDGSNFVFVEETCASEDFTLMRWMGAPFFSTTSF